jgi:hypothetical protein
MPDGPTRDQCRALARTRVDDLVSRLEAEGGRESHAEAIELAAHLASAIDSFHLEAIRFRMFTLDRLFSTGKLQASSAVLGILDELKHALEAAGFQTKSIAH